MQSLVLSQPLTMEGLVANRHSPSSALLRHPRRCQPPLAPARRIGFRVPSAISYSDEQLFGHRVQERQPPARELSEEDKQRRVSDAAERIRHQTEQRGQKLKSEAHLAHLEHELKFGKLMFAQGSYDSALAHFNKVVEGSQPETYYRGEGTLQKAACLEKLGREAEAHALYESLIKFRAPYPNIKRRAAQALFGASTEGAKAPEYDEYMYRMFVSGFGSYMPKEKYVETKEEKVVMSILPWAMLSMAPLLLAYLLIFQDRL